ncbi:hypothetical protein DFQ28_004197 [Apophysomyces sp. BC1034]|nr:hypothetical protein DFQ28_004197 [Apophysomyces sp. BC1034]
MYPKFKDRPDNEPNLPRAWDRNDSMTMKRGNWDLMVFVVIRTGIQITSSIHYNTLGAPSCANSIPIEDDKIPASVKMYWHCPHCDSTYAFTRHQVLEHLATCKI